MEGSRPPAVPTRPTPPPTPAKGPPWRLIIFGALAVYAILIVLLNRKQVEVSFVFFSVNTRLIWLILLSMLLGAGLAVEPARQTVPKDIATIVSTFLAAPDVPDQPLPPFAPDAVVKATLRGGAVDLPGRRDGAGLLQTPTRLLAGPDGTAPDGTDLTGELEFDANSWSANSWSANSWSANSWSANSWSANSWSANSWSANSWSVSAP